MKIIKYSIIILSSFLFINCLNKESVLTEKKIIGTTQGTYYAVTYFSKDTVNIQKQIDSLLYEFDTIFSTFNDSSLINKINNNKTQLIEDSLLLYAWNKSMEFSKLTNGAFDITVSPLIDAWGFGHKKVTFPDEKKIDSLKKIIGYNKVKLENNKIIKEIDEMQFNFNGIAQGYAVDVLGEFLISKGIDIFIIDIGGEIWAKGVRPGGKKWVIGIEKPAENNEDSRNVQISFPLQDKCISTSGSYRKYFENNGVKYSHTIDPSTGKPVQHSLLSVSVIADDCITADALCTAFMVMGLEKSKVFLENHRDYNAYFIYSDSANVYKTYMTDTFKNLTGLKD